MTNFFAPSLTRFRFLPHPPLPPCFWFLLADTSSYATYFPGNHYNVPEVTSGTATIRRKPSSKFNSVSRRQSLVPKPVKPPTVPGDSVAKLQSTFQPPVANPNNMYNAMRACHNRTNGQISPRTLVNNKDPKSLIVNHLTQQFKNSVDMTNGHPT